MGSAVKFQVGELQRYHLNIAATPGRSCPAFLPILGALNNELDLINHLYLGIKHKCLSNVASNHIPQ